MPRALKNRLAVDYDGEDLERIKDFRPDLWVRFITPLRGEIKQALG